MFICGICGKDHRTLQKKINCEKRGVEEIKFKKGDIVIVNGKYVQIWDMKTEGHHVVCKGHILEETGYDSYRHMYMKPVDFMQKYIEKLFMSAKEYDEKNSVCHRLETEVSAVIKKITGKAPEYVSAHLDYEGKYRVSAK